MNKNDLKLIKGMFENSFSYLKTEYDFSIIESKIENWGYTLTALNQTTGLKLVYEFKECYIVISLYKLINGEIVKNTQKALTTGEAINGFGLDYIIQYKNPSDEMKPSYEYDLDSVYLDEKNGRNHYIKKFANDLKKYADDILRGDFSIFPELEKIVRKTR